MNLIRFFKKCMKAKDVVFLHGKVSYSQAGEDMIIEYLFSSINIEKPTYLDIGCNLPKQCNNTYNLYLKGCKGVCVEPDEKMISKIKKVRTNDTILQVGIGDENNDAKKFYLFPSTYNGWSTFSEEEANIRTQKTGIKYEIKEVKMMEINHLISTYFNPYPNFISIDVEGYDLQILKKIDFAKYKPEVICVESISFGYLDNTEKKLDEIGEFMTSAGYFPYADTHINTIYCRNDIFKK